MTDVALTPEMGLAMLRQKRLHAIESRHMADARLKAADEEIRVLDGQILGFQAAVEMMTPAPELAAGEGGDKP